MRQALRLKAQPNGIQNSLHIIPALGPERIAANASTPTVAPLLQSQRAITVNLRRALLRQSSGPLVERLLRWSSHLVASRQPCDRLAATRSSWACALRVPPSNPCATRSERRRTGVFQMLHLGLARSEISAVCFHKRSRFKVQAQV